MEFSRYRPPVRIVAFWTILAWILLVTLLILGSIWELLDGVWIQRSLWTATVLTGAVLLACVTLLGFAASEEDRLRRRSMEEKARETSGERLHDALVQAKDPHPRGVKP